MQGMKFTELCLLSRNEQRAIRIPFESGLNILQGANGTGKSALIKSLYNAFGAQPHKIDNSWKGADVAILVKFKIDNTHLAALKARGHYSLFDANNKLLVKSTKIGGALTETLAKLLNFKLVMADRNSEEIIPPPAYMFAPFYIDQDAGWEAPWKSFDRLYLPNSSKVLAEFHTGLRPNEYYEAKALRDRLKAELSELSVERKALDSAFIQFRETGGAITLNYNLEDFRKETELLVARSDALHSEQVAYRRKISDLSEERSAWLHQTHLLKKALAELDGNFATAAELLEEVECPVCGAEYHNSIMERFELIEDRDGLTAALTEANTKVSEITLRDKAESALLRDIEKSLYEIRQILSTKKKAISLQQVVAAEGRNVAWAAFRQRIEESDEKIANQMRLITDAQKEMDGMTSKERTQNIQSYFFETYSSFADQLDVRIPEKKVKVTSKIEARGSELPRALLAFYYATLRTTHRFSTMTYCPLVLDAPNQQGQDDDHMPKVMRFISDQRPPDTQVIMATESLFGLSKEDGKIMQVGERKNQILREADYDEVSALMRPYLEALL